MANNKRNRNWDHNYGAMSAAQNVFIDIVKTLPADCLTSHARLDLMQDVSKAVSTMFLNMEDEQPSNVSDVRWLAEKAHEFGNAVRTLEAHGLTGDLLPEGCR